MYCLHVLLLTIFFNNVLCRDFVLGMFKKNDFLVAQDRVYRERIPYRTTMSKYGRLFKCPITYFRVVDRLGVGRAPRIEILRGGLLKKYLVLRFTSAYNLPLSVNIYVGCDNKGARTPKTTTEATTIETTLSSNGTIHDDNEKESNATTIADHTDSAVTEKEGEDEHVTTVNPEGNR